METKSTCQKKFLLNFSDFSKLLKLFLITTITLHDFSVENTKS